MGGFMRLSPVASAMSKRNAEQIGFAMQLYATHPKRQEWNISRLGALVIAAVYHEKIRFFFNQDGAPIGLVIWAFPSQEIQDFLLQEPNYVLHESEWDENGTLWILDFLAPPDHMICIMNELRHTTFAAQKIVKFVRTDARTNRRRVVSWVLR